MIKKSIDELRSLLDNNEIAKEDLYKESLKLANINKEYNSFVTLISDYKYENNNSTMLSGIPYALKDNVSTKGILTTGSSNILSNYVPVFDATVYKKLKQSGAILMGKTVLDELAMGGTGTTGHTGIVKNPWNKEHIIGGSSAGSAAAVALGIVPFAIGTDTGDSIRKPAAYAGVVGYKPTYGRVSRYGIFPFASSLDHVGCFARSVKDISYAMDIIKGHDDKDMTSLEDENINYSDYLEESVKGKKLFYIKEACNIELYKESDSLILENLKQFHTNIDKIRSLGIEVEEVSIDINLLKALYPSYMAISCAEATSNNANLTGIHFGNKKDGNNVNEIMFNTRTNGFSELIKRRFVIGSYILRRENQEKLYLNALRIRRLIVNKINELFKEYDGLIMPATSSIPPKIGDSSNNLSSEYLILDNHLVIGNFGGYPSITLPSGYISDMPVAINITGKAKEDKEVLNIASQIEKVLEYENKLVKEDK